MLLAGLAHAGYVPLPNTDVTQNVDINRVDDDGVVAFRMPDGSDLPTSVMMNLCEAAEGCTNFNSGGYVAA